jgi:hypothetical protein
MVLALSPSSNKVFFYCCSVNSTQQRSTQNPRDSHHVEGVEGKVVEPLIEQDESEDGSHTKAGGEEPTGLSKGYIRKTLTNTAIGPEKAIALYGRILLAGRFQIAAA